jgi:hypothetical protein
MTLLENRPSFARYLLLALAVMLMTVALQAQSNFGSIQGSVQDKSGALIPGATVTVTALGTNEVREARTNKQGGYDVEALQPVVYRIVFTAPGFKPVTVENVKVNTASNATVNATLQVVGTVQEITVTTETSQLQSEDGTPSFTINQRSIQQMPLNGRNTLSLALTLPGASGNAGSEYGTIYSNPLIPGRELIMNGGRPGTSQFMADGQNVTSAGLARTTVSFSPDTIQEFTVLESNFSAQYSQAGGAVIQQTTRGGSNQLYGDVYWFYRTRGFQATPFDGYTSSSNPTSPLQRNQMGVVVGGPVVLPKVYHGKNKTFFFVTYEPTRQNVGNTTMQHERVPTAEERQGNFCDSLVYNSNGTTSPYRALYNHFVKDSTGALDYAPAPAGTTNSAFAYNFANNIFDPVGAACANGPGHQLGAFLNPASAKLAALYEQPNIPMVTTGSNAGSNYAYFRRAKSIDNRYSFRIDQVLPKNNTMFVRATIEPNSTDRMFRDVATEPGTSDSSNAKQILLSETGVIRANIINDIRIGYSGGDFARNFPSNYLSKDGTTPIVGTGGTPNVLGYGIANFFNGASPTGGGASWSGIGQNGIQNINRDREHYYSASDDFTWIHGRHTFHAGVLASQQQLNIADMGAGYLAGGRWNFSNATNNSSQCSYSSEATIKNCKTDGSTGDSFAAFLEGVPQSVTFFDNVSPTYHYRWFSFGSYVQDDFKLRPNLTVNVGLRHQYQSPRWETNNRQGQLDLTPSTYVTAEYPASYGVTGADALAPLFRFAGHNGLSRYLDPPQHFDFEPRFGFSWSPTHAPLGHDVVIRGGYGITHDVLTGRSRVPFPALGENPGGSFRAYDPVQGNAGQFNSTNVQGCGWASCQVNTPGQFVYNNLSYLPDPSLFVIPANGIISPAANGSVLGYDARYMNTGVIFAKDFKTPYVQNFSLQVQTQLSRTTALTLGWQGSKGTKLFSTPYDINNNPVAQTTLIPGYWNGPGAGTNGGSSGQIILEDSTHSGSIYHAMIVNLEHRFSHGLQANFNYTWGKSLDDSSGGIDFDWSKIGSQDQSSQTIQGNAPQTSYGTTNERSVSVFNTPQVYNATVFYELPLGKGKTFLNQSKVLDYIVGGYQLSGLLHITSGQSTYVTLGDENRLDDYAGGSNWYAPRPSIFPGVPFKNPDWKPSNANTVPYVNPRAFDFQAPATFGNSPRMLGLPLPWSKTIDGSVFKTFYPFENKQHAIEIRAEFFNLLNTRTFSINGVSTNLTNGINQNDPGQANRYANLTPAVWDQYLKGNCAYKSLSGSNNTVDSASTVCGELGAIYNSSFYILGANSQNNGVSPRQVQLAAKIYF